MKRSLLHCSLVLTSFVLAFWPVAQAGGQDPASSGAGPVQPTQATGLCAQQPCYSAHTGRKTILPPPRIKTPEELVEQRYRRVFAGIKGQEQAAQRAEAAGDPKMAAYWRDFFAGQSGLSREQADAVKKIAEKYESDSSAFQAKRNEAIVALRRGRAGEPVSGSPPPEIAALREERAAIFTNAKADLIRELGSKGFAQLDSYALHRDDNMKSLAAQKIEQTKQLPAKDTK